jgi:putative methyltransferase (TIGR04325 family)
MIKYLQRLRMFQSKQTFRLLCGIERLPGGSTLLQFLVHWRATAPILDLLLGYHRTFDGLEDAEAAIRPYGGLGHETPEYIEATMSLKQGARSSYYAVMFHMQRMNLKGAKIFDLGGHTGMMFYEFDRRMGLPDCSWLIYDLPAEIEVGKRLAASRSERRILFTRSWGDASGADLVIASGSLAYFETPLATMISKLPEKPKRVLINRTPLIDGSTKATVEEGGAWRIACTLYNKAELIGQLKAIGYELVDEWDCHEYFIRIVGKPEASALPCTGLYFVLAELRRPSNNNSF